MNREIKQAKNRKCSCQHNVGHSCNLRSCWCDKHWEESIGAGYISMTQDNKKEMAPTIQKQIEDEAMREMACWETEVHIKNCPKCSKKYALDEIIKMVEKYEKHCANKKPQHKCSACIVAGDIKLDLLKLK